MTEKPHNDADALLDGIDKTLSDFKTKAYEAKKSYDQSELGRAHRELSALGRFWSQFVRSCGWIYLRLIAPVTWRIYRFARWTFARYRALWARCVYAKDAYGDLEFSKARGGIMILATVAVCYLIYGAVTVAATLPWYLATVRHDEQLYLSNSQNLSSSQTGGPEIHEVYGCETLPCTDQNTVTFRVRATWFNEIWSLLHHGSLFYPGYVAAAVSPVLNRCVITSYGVRKKFLVRSWELYPDLVQVECMPTDAGESKDSKVINNRDYR
jgi:hypothetical protein